VTRFRSVAFDLDSTLSALEGIDWLAARRAPAVAVEVAELTRRAMEGELRIDELYGRRLELVRPTRDEIAALGAAYVDAVVPGVRSAVGSFRAAGLRLVIVSGGLREAILPFAVTLGFAPGDVHAVGIRHHPDGSYAGWETTSPLATSTGKEAVLRSLGLPTPLLGVGDGTTDLAMRDAGATFAAFVGVVRRESVARQADHAVTTFDELSALVLA
jgi:phosphoserine phosphatase